MYVTFYSLFRSVFQVLRVLFTQHASFYRHVLYTIKDRTGRGFLPDLLCYLAADAAPVSLSPSVRLLIFAFYFPHSFPPPIASPFFAV